MKDNVSLTNQDDGGFGPLLDRVLTALLTVLEVLDDDVREARECPSLGEYSIDLFSLIRFLMLICTS